MTTPKSSKFDRLIDRHAQSISNIELHLSNPNWHSGWVYDENYKDLRDAIQKSRDDLNKMKRGEICPYVFFGIDDVD